MQKYIYSSICFAIEDNFKFKIKLCTKIDSIKTGSLRTIRKFIDKLVEIFCRMYDNLRYCVIIQLKCVLRYAKMQCWNLNLDSLALHQNYGAHVFR